MKLMISRDAGCSYFEEMRAETMEPLLARAEELRLDEQMLRWAIESDDEREVYEIGGIQKRILADVTRARQKEE